MEKSVSSVAVLEIDDEFEVTVLHPEGELDSADLRAFAQHCFRQAKAGRLRLVLDLEDVHHIDYRGVASLRAAQALLARAGGDLKLAGVSPYLASILRAAGAFEQFDICADAAQARLAFDAINLNQATTQTTKW
jgi:anti-anti-sigma factor